MGRLARKVKDEDVLHVRGNKLCTRWCSGGVGSGNERRACACVRLALNLGWAEGRCQVSHL